MSIRRKMALFGVALVVIPMLVSLAASRIAFNKQIQETERNYLSVALKIVQNKMESRKDSMRNAGVVASNEIISQKYIENNDKAGMIRVLNELEQVNGIWDYAVILDKNNDVLAKASSQMRYNKPIWLDRLVNAAGASKSAITSDESFELEDLFYNGSILYKKFVIKINNPHPGEKEEFTKGEAGVAVIPIINENDEHLGTIIFADVINNDEFFPNHYSDSIQGSFLAFSVDGVRLCTNITNIDKTKRGMGTEAPQGIGIIDQGEKQYFGTDSVLGETHIFLDEKISNYWGENVAVVGVGIPDYRFQAIITDNNTIVVYVSIACLLVMLLLGDYVAKKISKPIIVATQKAEELNIVISGDKKVTDDSYGDEGKLLVKTLDVFSENLLEHKKEKDLYTASLEEAHLKQMELTKELQGLNEQLEKTVNDKTMHLQGAIKELQEANQAKAQFLANISHELRTPLNVIIGSAEILKEPMLGELTQKQNNYVDNIHSSGTHLLQLINDILDVSKIAAGKMQLNISEFGIKDVVNQTVRNMSSYIAEKRLNIDVTISPEDFLVRADVQKIRQILYNLVSNAVKFTNNDGHIRIKVVKLGNMMEVLVKDDGIGIAEEDQERVFKEFEQVDTSYSRENGGTGLGLPLVKKLVEMHGGTVFLKSKKDEGTEILFTIPCQKN
ncbi:MAG: ATP-binding protein [Acidaminococcaceae bacterium]